MKQFLRRHLTTFVVASLTALVTAGGPPLAAAVFDAENARNADKVDNRHAVGADATVSGRAGKLVAANASGRLPNNIITKAPDADRLDGLNSSALQRRAVRTVLVSPVGSPTANGTALRQALAGIPTEGAATPSATNKWLVKLEPGIYDLGTEALDMRGHVHLEGSGAASTIRCTCDDSIFNAAVRDAPGVHLRAVAIENIGQTGLVLQYGTSLYDVSLAVADADDTVSGVFISTTAPVLFDRVTIRAIGPASVGDDAYGIVSGLGTLEIRGTSITAREGSTNYGIAANGFVRIDHSSVEAIGTSKFALLQNNTTARVSGSMLEGGVSGTGVRTCVASYNGSYVPLQSTCVP